MSNAREEALPTPVRSTFVHDGNEVVSHTWPAEGEPRFLLIHGIGMGHWVYEKFIVSLREEIHPGGGVSCEVNAIDLPGFGDSPVPQEALSIEQTADLVALALEEELVETPLTVVGHSMGAQVAAELAARHPHLVTSLVLIGATVNPHERSLAKQAQRMVQDLGTERVSVLVKGALAYVQAGPKWFIEKLGPTLEHRIEDALPRITQPTLVLRGDEDRVSPAEWGHEMVTLLPHATYAEITGHGHEAIIASGSPAVTEIRRWLTAL